MSLPILPPPNHRGPRILLAGLLSVGVHAAAVGFATAFPVASPVVAVTSTPEVTGPEAPMDFGPLPTDLNGLELPPPELTAPETPEVPEVVTLEAEPPPPSTASDEFTEPTPVLRRDVTVPTTRLTTARPVTSVRTGVTASANPGGETPGNGGVGSGASLGGSGGRWVTPKPPYPAQAKMMRQTGSGSVRIQTDAAGRVVRAEMVQSITPALDATTTNFARTRWSGPPNRTVVIPVTFELR